MLRLRNELTMLLQMAGPRRDPEVDYLAGQIYVMEEHLRREEQREALYDRARQELRAYRVVFR